MLTNNDNIRKGHEGEEAVRLLAYKTYLKYWCYPGPKDEQGDKKEICDLMIIFKESLLLISVKNYLFNGNYERYFRNTLEKAQAQLQGAERKLFSLDRQIFFKHPEKQAYDTIDKDEVKTIHRIIVNMNNAPLFYPGGLSTNKNEFIHVFNWDAFLRSVEELNTIADVVQYLNARCACFKERQLMMMTGSEADYDAVTSQAFLVYSSRFNPMHRTTILVSGSELDLLADFYFNGKKFNPHFYSREYSGASFELDGKWENYLGDKAVQRKKEDDKVSYFIDEFVKREILYKADDSNLELAMELLAFSRFERRIVGKHFFDFCAQYDQNDGYFVARRYAVINDMVVGFMLYGHQMKHDHVMASLQIAIEGYCMWEKYKTKKIMMIAVSNQYSGFRFGYMKDITPFSTEDEALLVHDLKLLNWFTNLENFVYHIKEYPD